MRTRSSVLLFTAVAAVATSAAVLTAQQRLEPLFPGQRAPKAPSLFPVQPFEVPQVPQSPQAPSHPRMLVIPSNMNALPNLKPRVVCGMTLIPAPPGVDPKIADQREAEKPKTPTTYTIRPVQPSICW